MKTVQLKNIQQVRGWEKKDNNNDQFNLNSVDT